MLAVLEEQLAAAQRSLPAPVYEYYAAGAGEETTLAESARAWSAFRLRPRPLRDVSAVDLTTTLLGAPLEAPLLVAPMAFHRLAHEEAEAATARGTREAGGLMVVSTRASLAVEDIGAVAGPWWFQVYVMKDRDITARLVERAAASGAQALVLTGDTPYVGVKRKVGGVRIDMPEDHFLVNLRRHLGDRVDGAAAAAQDPSVDLGAVEWLRRLTGLPVVVKGVLRGDAAQECLDAGAAGVVVSNHGGRQLDRAVPSALALAEVVDAVAGRAPVLVDGGVRSGLDALVALALGASGVLVGRPVLWALAHGGADGVRAALAAVRDDLAHALALCGAASLAELDRSFVVPAAAPVPGW
ncbi:alpha-hydroxy acid oxidase [Vallicoccus soli]|uniref:Alpha-hydroxy-acid oxidizing protein n=1 Tax=Vallicoccus soli TaxID=2339232 RepID=A0A3A3Z0Z1_9ACTN|nr:alpha-hydroxy acid oxidase [Vallicoccus soli]RJK97920.1 alpha-hydroxy-acid oxidizing protein [Vallicoccus soli]